jgi:polyisoprenoid-binding protein YceI
MTRFLTATALIALLAYPAIGEETGSATPNAATTTPAVADLPAGSYALDKMHSTLFFRVSHLGFSNYTASFNTFDVKLELDPANPASAKVEATIDPASLTLFNAPQGFLEELLSANWLNAGQFQQMTFRSTKVELTEANSARITGDFTFHGVTKPVSLDAKFNGGYAGHPLDPHARIGFSAKGVIKRSDFGVAAGIPAPGTTMGVSDEIEIIIETEFNGPAWKEIKPAVTTE